MIRYKGCLAFCLLLLIAQMAISERIKDIVDIKGMRGNPLSGTGLVVGLAGTGDRSALSRQMLTNVLRDSGLVLSPNLLTGNNAAVVMVTAELGPFDREGARIDVTVSAIGDAKSLQGGILLPTPLKGLDGQVYAVAQGGISLGGWAASGNQATATSNHATVGLIPGGAIVEKAELAQIVEQVGQDQLVTFSLRNGDFTTASRIGELINGLYPASATVLDASTIQVKIPDIIGEDQLVRFLDSIISQEVQVDTPAVVVINERTGTVVVGENVTISKVAVAHGSLVVKVTETATVSQPVAPFSNAGTTQVIPETFLEVNEPPAHIIVLPKAVTVAEIAKYINAIGATPRDLIAIFNALKQAGALQARLIIM
ncbi:MAG: flagellar basal body P-ring protein FlgI [Sedimentisphaerales bacterium]|nr:flagellar basal body P-ring protein FlgI [Sedimentisphaerales bacterium]